MSLHNLKRGSEEEVDQQQRKCPNDPLPPLDHKVMSKAERRRAAKNETPATREEREQARENLQELRRTMRKMKQLGWRGKVRRQDRELQKRGRAGEEEHEYTLNEDAADFDAEEERVLQDKMGMARTRKGAGGASSTTAGGDNTNRRNVSGLKKHRTEDSW